MTTYYPGDRVRVTYETTVDEDGHYFGAGFAEEVHQNQTVEVIERHNPRTTDPVGTVVKLDTFPATYDWMYVVKIGTDSWADLGVDSQVGNVRIFTDDDNVTAEYVGHVSQLDAFPTSGNSRENETPTPDVSSRSYFRHKDDGGPTAWVEGLADVDLPSGWVECDASGSTYVRDADGDVWKTLPGDNTQLVVWQDLLTSWDLPEDAISYAEVKACYGPLTPITPADLTTVQRSQEK